jgi:large subunit ribosomal protein L25
MKTTEIVGFNRVDLGTKSSKALRADGNVPCVLYGGSENIHFQSPAYLFKDLLYTPNVYIVKLNVEGVEKNCILKDAQFHPVSEMILHVDFLEIFDDKKVTMDIPVELEGVAPGAAIGGQIYIKNKTLRVTALPGNIPETVKVNISSLQLGQSLKVSEVATVGDYEILTNKTVSIVSIIVPRALKAAGGEGEGDAEAEDSTEAEA